MKIRPWWVIGLAMALAVAIAFPPEVISQAQRSAGKISRMIPTVNVHRASRQLAAAVQTPILWGDTLLSQAGGRARISLDDGSILNLGSDSSLAILTHDASAQKTQVQLAFGHLRSNVVRIAKSGGSFEARTPAAVAGIVGTDFYISYVNGVTTVIVFEGVVRVCDLQGNCVTVSAGQMTTVRQGQKPDQPTQASPAAVMDAGRATEVPGGEAMRREGPVHSRWVIFGLVLAAVLPAVLIPALDNRTRSPYRNTNICNVPNPPPSCD